MNHLDTELQILKADTLEMWGLVINQISKAQEAIMNFDTDLAHEIHANEKRVDAFELKLNMDCENILALFNPVAIDLRFVLAVLKINYNLERIGDYANGISHIIMDSDKEFSKDLLKETKINEMFEMGLNMLTQTYESFSRENKSMVKVVFEKDKFLNDINKNANNIIAGIIASKPEEINQSLNLLSIIRKLERVGDQTLNIAEEIIFYIEAKVLKHSKLSKRETNG